MALFMAEVATPQNEEARPRSPGCALSPDTLKSKPRTDIPSKPTSLLKFQNTWCFWYNSSTTHGMSETDFKNSTRRIGSFSTIKEFWEYWNNFIEPTSFPKNSSLFVFKDGIEPSWEDPANINGGKWTIIADHTATNKAWISTILTMIGEQFPFSNDICGAALVVKSKFETINLWNRSAENQDLTSRISSHISHVLNQMPRLKVVYKAHFSQSSHRLSMSDSRCLVHRSLPNFLSPTLASSQRITRPLFETDVPVEENYNDDELSDLDAINSKHKKSSSFTDSPFTVPRNNGHRKSLSESKDKRISLCNKELHATMKVETSENHPTMDDATFSPGPTTFISPIITAQDTVLDPTLHLTSTANLDSGFSCMAATISVPSIPSATSGENIGNGQLSLVVEQQQGSATPRSKITSNKEWQRSRARKPSDSKVKQANHSPSTFTKKTKLTGRKHINYLLSIKALAALFVPLILVVASVLFFPL